MARTAAGAALLLQAMAGQDPGDPRQRDVPARRLRRRGRARRATTCAACASASSRRASREDVGAEPATCEAVRAAVERLRRSRRRAARASRCPSTSQAGGVAFAGFVEGMTRADDVAAATASAGRGRYWEELAPAHRRGPARARQRALAAGQDGARRRACTCASTLGGAPYARAQNLRPWLRAAYDRALDDVDVLLMPTTPFRAFRLDDELRTSERVLRGWANLAQHVPDRHVRAIPRSRCRSRRPTACRSASCSSGAASTTRGCSRSPPPASGRSAGLSPSSARRT